MILVYRYRVKSLNGLLNAQARAVDYVWNYCNNVQKHALKWGRKWPTGFDLTYLTAGAGAELGLTSGTVSQVCHRYAKSRRQHRRPFLRYRGKKSLGWVPIRGDFLKRSGAAFRFAGQTFRVFNSRPLPEGKIRDGSNFSRDARGNWFLNIVIDVPEAPRRSMDVGVGIDLGLASLATLSTGEKIDNTRPYRTLESRLGMAQRAGKRRQAARINSRIANGRRDRLHKLSHRLTHQFDYIAVGNVNAAGLAKTSMAKSVNDAGWSTLRRMLAYKAIRHGAQYEEVNESFSSQVCSECGALPASRPKGIAGTGIRQWVCDDCGAIHDRDINAAVNILARSGHRAPAEGAGAPHWRRECQTSPSGFY